LAEQPRSLVTFHNVKPDIRVGTRIWVQCILCLDLRQVSGAYVTLCATYYHQVGTVIVGSTNAAAYDLQVIEQILQDTRVRVELSDPCATPQHQLPMSRYIGGLAPPQFGGPGTSPGSHRGSQFPQGVVSMRYDCKYTPG
jgi:hypothetical protein